MAVILDLIPYAKDSLLLRQTLHHLNTVIEFAIFLFVYRSFYLYLFIQTFKDLLNSLVLTFLG